MRLLILSPEFPPGPGGIGTHAYQLARYLCERGWAVTVVTAQDYAPNSEIADFNARQPFQIIRLARLRGVPIRVLYRAGVFWRQIRRLKPDVILAANERAVWAVAALKGRIPAVAVGHGTEFGLTGLQAWLNRWAYARLDHIVCVSQFTWDMMIRQGIAPRRGSIIPNGADEAHFKVIDGAPVQEFRARHGLDQARLLLTVGHVTERKGQQVVIRALPQILKEVPDVHYLVAGLPALKQKYSALAESLGVADRVHFLGRVAHDELPVLMNACDVLIMTSCILR